MRFHNLKTLFNQYQILLEFWLNFSLILVGKEFFFRQQRLHIQVKTHRLPNAHRRPTTKGETAREAGGDPRVETLETWRMDHLFELAATFP